MEMETPINVEKLRIRLTNYVRKKKISIAKMSRDSDIDYLALFRFINGDTKNPTVDHINTMIDFLNREGNNEN